ncbi:penicillin-binding protein 2 [Halomonas sp. 22501_18_FS]|uniref:Peptidoglycan D,D-transpeptidase FtsI n=2 Tax=Pseudomonadota TaxID=1224 RepID=A0A9X4YBG5_9GAMM|nr:penicillin-binding protein 2 [Halospina sp. K52047b]MYL26664.1 penicillin-binding protein 2 [Halomonas utahensis]MYL74001.1 penicillin-binding protein 2 [Halomonas sp. 22501_18_FS]
MAGQKHQQTARRHDRVAMASWRHLLVLVAVLGSAAAVGARLVELQVLDNEFLREQGEARTARVEPIDANRGVIRDRHGEPLAISTPVKTLWANPGELPSDHPAIPRLAEAAELDAAQLRERLASNSEREFLYLRRKVQPALAREVMELEVPGVYSRREYRRYYPAGEVTSHVIGFTNIDEQGQEGMELSFNHWLAGEKGSKRVLRDNRGRTIRDLGPIREAHPGNDLNLSLDLRLQYLAYRELKAAVEAHGARGGTVVMLDVDSGEILAMANQPALNPNDRGQRDPARVRNRAITDLYEPGSTVKPFTAAAALESGEFTPETVINTSPGYRQMGAYTIRDHHDYGRLSLAEIIVRSSNVGISRVASELSGERLQNLFYSVGFGQSTGIGFPGESVGILPASVNLRPVEVAALSYGYGLSVNALQMAQAYMTLANGGIRYPVTLLKNDEAPKGHRVMSQETARQVRAMLARVVEEGTGTRADQGIYRLAGKTGTVHLVGASGYEADQYKALFAGMGPVDDPQVVTVVTVDAPSRTEYYGGEVAAPIFGRIMGDALRLLNVSPSGGASMADESTGTDGGQG